MTTTTGRVNVHLVDGTYELFRAFFGAPSATGPDGREVGAARQIVRTMGALLREPGVTHVAVAFDTVIESFRNDLFDGYKTGAGIDPTLLGQFPLAEAACEAMGIVVWRMIAFEADDALAAGAAKYGADPRVAQVVLCSPDKDLAQCVVGSRVVTRDRMRKRTLDEAGVVEKFGVSPRSIPDLLALVGDTADGIPGLPRWGMKSTAAVLGRYEHVDAIPDDVADWDIKVRGGATLAKTLATSRDAARLYRTLATLRTDVPLAEELDDLRWRGVPRDRFEALCAEALGPRLERSVPRWR